MKGISGMSDGSVAAWWRRVLRADADGWDRRPERRALYDDYAAFCKRTRAEPVGMDAFLRGLRALMPARGFAPCLRTAPEAGGPRGRWRGEIEVHVEHLCLPGLAECRRAFDAANGPCGWPGCPGGAEADEPDVSGVADWWRWKLLSGVTVPDEADPYGRDDLYWNPAPAADMLLASYRGFCADAGRGPVLPGFFAELFEGLFPLGDVRSDRRIAFRGRAEGGDGRLDAARLERVPCYRIPPLGRCRIAFSACTGGEEVWPEAADPGRDTPVTRAGDREAVRLWWRWKLALGCVILDDADCPRRPADGPAYRWDANEFAPALHADCAEFCRRHGRPPVEYAAFLAGFAPLVPAGLPGDPSREEVGIPPLDAGRAWFEERIAGRPVPWPTPADGGD